MNRPRHRLITPRLAATRRGAFHGRASTLWIIVGTLFAAMNAAYSQTPKPIVREIFVPIKELDSLLQGPTRRVLLTSEEFADLLKKAKPVTNEKAPVDAVLLSADYQVAIAGERARLRGMLTLEVLADGLHALPLVFDGVGIEQALLDDKSAALGGPAGGPLMLFVEGRGRHKLALEMVTPLETTASRQTLTFQLPQPAATKLRVNVPGNVEVRSGAEVISREVDEQASVTRFELVPQAGKTTLEMSLNNRQKRDERVVVARSVLVDEVTAAYERLHATVSLSVLHRPVDRFQFVVPEGFEVTDVHNPLLASWSVKAEQGRRVLDVLLRQTTTEMQVLNISAVRGSQRFDAWTFPRLEPLEVVGQVAIVGVLVEDQLKAEAVASEGLLALDTTVLAQALPASVLAAEPGAPRVRPVVAYYAPTGDYQLSARFVRPPARLRVTSNLLLTLSDTGLSMHNGFALAPEAEKLHELDFTIPTGWHVDRLTMTSGATPRFEQHAAADGTSRIHVRLPAGIEAGQTDSLYFVATFTPPKWLDDWTTMPVTFPAISVVGAAREIGAIAVEARDDLAVRPDTLTDLTPMDENEKAKYGLGGVASQLAYRFDAPGYKATLTVDRTPPRLSARTFSCFRVDPELLACHYELIYTIERARARRLTLRLPDSTPSAITIRGLDGVAIKEYTSEALPDTKERRWTVSLADAAAGRVRLAVDFQQPLPSSEPRDFPLPIVKADGVVFQSGVVSVEGNADFDVQMAKNPRRVDVGELADAEYQPGRRLLGVFGFIAEDSATAVNVFKQPGYALQPALVQQARYLTLLSANGLSQTAAQFSIRTSTAFLEVQLPAGSTLWSAELDGQPAKPQRQNDSLLLNFPTVAGQPLRDLRIVYETPVAAVGQGGTVSVPALRLLLRSRDAAASEVPVADAHWDVYLPTGYRLLQSDGTVTPVEGYTPHQELAAWQFLGAFFSPVNTLGKTRYSARTAATEQETAARNAWVTDEMAVPKSEPQAESKPVAGEPMTPVPPPMPAPAPAAAAKPAEPPGEKDAAKKLDDYVANPLADGKFKKSGAGTLVLAGVRSLKIDLDDVGQKLEFQSLGVEPRLSVTLASNGRLRGLAWALGLAVFVYGLKLTPEPALRKAKYIVGVGLAATLIPLLTGWFELAVVFNGAFYAACWLVPTWLAIVAVRAAAGVVRRAFTAKPKPAVTAAAVMLVALLLNAHASTAAEPAPAAPPIRLPDDATIHLYSPTDSPGLPKTEQLLVPYDRYVELWNRAYPDKKITDRPPPADYAPAGGAYTATLNNSDDLLVTGKLEFDLFTDKAVEIPLPLAGGVLASATLDGKPARLKVVEAAQAGKKSAAAPDGGTTMFLLYAQGQGRRRLDLAVRFKVTRDGGWRVVDGRLPPLAAASLALTVPEVQTEVRLVGLPDKRSHETDKPNVKLTTALGTQGVLRIEWRPKITLGQVDAALKVRSQVLLDVQEDGLRLAWDAALEFGRSQRETFTLVLPAGYLVERVVGDNVRGWEAREAGGARQLEVTLLRPATETERFTLHLSKRERLGDKASELDVPIVSVGGAALHNGQLAIRRGAVLDLRTIETKGVTRTDFTPGLEQKSAAAEATDRSPLGLVPYQSYTFAGLPFSVKLGVEPLEPKATADVQTIWRVADRDRALETRVNLTVQGRPLHELRVMLPEDFRLEQVTAPVGFEWAVTSQDGRPLVTVYFATGVLGQVPVVLLGPVGATGPVAELPLPKLEVLDVERQSGTIVVQVDPATNVESAGLAGAESVLLDRTATWLNPQQRQLSRLAIEYQAPGYSGTIRLSARQPVVNVSAVSNVRVTDLVIEETILLDFTIRNAGIREVAFLLPTSLRDAKISVPMLRQKIIEPVGAADPPTQVRVRLQLQDAVMDQLRVLIENDRLRSREVQDAPLPVVETGTTDGRFVALEGSGRDELVVDKLEGLEELARQQQQSQAIVALLRGGGQTQVYRVRPDAAAPRLAFRTQDRAAVETAGARIELAEADLVVDAVGAYRARQQYHVNNTTEQFLTVELPAGAVLWTAWVAGEPVKPSLPPAAPVAAGPAASGPNQPAVPARQIRIPLVKTAEGDLNYLVVLTYGGKLPSLGSVDRVSFPLLRTVNINVELSQVRLYLPETHNWFDFGGTMRLTADEGDLLADKLSYFSKVAERLTKTMQNTGSFSSVRANSNLDQLKVQIESYRGEASKFSYNEAVKGNLVLNGGVLQQAEEQAQKVQQALPQITTADDNRRGLNDLFINQSNTYSGNTVVNSGTNFSIAGQGPMDAKGITFGNNRTGYVPQRGGQQFDSGWFAGNKLSNAAPATPSSRVQLDGTMDAERKKELAEQLNRPMPQQAGQPQAPQSMNPGLQPTAPPAKDYRSREDAEREGLGQRQNANGRADRDGAAQQQGDVLQRYQQRLANQSAQQVTPMPPARDEGRSSGSSFGWGTAAGGMGGVGGGGIVGGRPIGGPASGPVSATTARGKPQDGRGGFANDIDAPFNDALPQGLASLDVQIPERGTVYRFTTPRGEQQITARAASSRLLEGLGRLGIVAVAAVLLWLGWRIATSPRVAAFFHRPLGWGLTLALGLLLLVLFGLPLLGVVLILTAIALATTRVATASV